MISLIGKIRLSAQCAREVAGILGYRQLPDPVVRWLLLCYESEAEDTEYMRNVLRIYDQARPGDLVDFESLVPRGIKNSACCRCNSSVL